MRVYRLRFTSSLHLGRGRQEWTEIDPLPHSDTLTAALFSLWPHLFPEDAVEKLADEPPLCALFCFALGGGGRPGGLFSSLPHWPPGWCGNRSKREEEPQKN